MKVILVNDAAIPLIKRYGLVPTGYVLVGQRHARRAGMAAVGLLILIMLGMAATTWIGRLDGEVMEPPVICAHKPGGCCYHHLTPEQAVGHEFTPECAARHNQCGRREPGGTVGVGR